MPYEKVVQALEGIVADMNTKGCHFSYEEIIERIKKETGDKFSFRLSSTESISARLDFLEGFGYLKKDDENKYYRKRKKFLTRKMANLKR